MMSWPEPASYRENDKSGNVALLAFPQGAGTCAEAGAGAEPEPASTLAVTSAWVSLIAFTKTRATCAMCAKTRGGWTTRAAAPVVVVVLAAAVTVLTVVLDAACRVVWWLDSWTAVETMMGNEVSTEPDEGDDGNDKVSDPLLEVDAAMLEM